MGERAMTVTLVAHGIILLALIGAITALAWHGKVGEQAVMAVIGAVIGLVGGSAGTLAVQSFAQAPAVESAAVTKSQAATTVSAVQ